MRLIEDTVLGLIAMMVIFSLGSHFLGGKYTHPHSDAQYASTTAMITNLAENSGGTGVIYQSTKDASYILTNAHVCGVVKQGGIVNTEHSKNLVSSFRVSKTHDLCLIEVKTDLHVNTEVSNHNAALYSPSTISGHPGLLPTVVNHGNFGAREFIKVFTGFRECTKEDTQGPDAAMCVFFGGIPVIKEYEAQFSTALISPGSSGSAVFNNDGRIEGLAFAGSGALNYAHAVPREYVEYFTAEEVQTLERQYPKMNETDSGDRATAKLQTLCKEGNTNVEYTKYKNLCEYLDEEQIYSEAN